MEKPGTQAKPGGVSRYEVSRCQSNGFLRVVQISLGLDFVKLHITDMLHVTCGSGFVYSREAIQRSI